MSTVKLKTKLTNFRSYFGALHNNQYLFQIFIIVSTFFCHMHLFCLFVIKHRYFTFCTVLKIYRFPKLGHPSYLCHPLTTMFFVPLSWNITNKQEKCKDVNEKHICGYFWISTNADYTRLHHKPWGNWLLFCSLPLKASADMWLEMLSILYLLCYLACTTFYHSYHTAIVTYY